MNKLTDKQFYYIFIALFLILNIFNGYVVSLPIFNPGLNLYKLSPISFITSLFGDLGFLLIVLSLVLLTSRNKRTVVLKLTVVTILLSVIVFLLKIYSFYYGTAFSFFNLRTFSNSNPELGRQLTIFLWKNLLSMGQYVAILPAIVLIVMTVLAIKKERFPINYFYPQTHKRNYLKLVNVLILGLGFYSFSAFSFQYNIKASKEFGITEDLEAIQNMGVYTYLSHDLVSYLTDSPEEIEKMDPEIYEQSLLYLEENKQKNPLNFFGEITNNTEAIFKDKTLIVLQMESFNDFLINLHVEDPETGKNFPITPFLNSLVNNQENLYYDNFYSNIGVGKTSDAEFATLTGIVANGNIVTYFDYIHEDYETLPKLFTAKGYETYALRGSNMSFYRREEVYTDLGFNPLHLVSEESLILDGILNPTEEYLINGWVDDYDIFNKIIEFLETADPNEKQFIFSLTTILHSPFMEHPAITGEENNPLASIIEGQMGRYLEYARYFDTALQYLFKTLEEKKLTDDVVFILYGDHKTDMSMTEHKKLFPEIETVEDFQKITHNVPLIITAPGYDLSNYNYSTSLVRSQRDLKRTISNLFGLDAEFNFGVDILTADRTVAYVPLTMDVFTDEFHLNYRGEVIQLNNVISEKNEETTDYLTVEYIENFKRKFARYKALNDSILHNNFFKELNDGT